MTITFEFSGGSLDGLITTGDHVSPGNDSSEADGYYFITHEGRVGARFWFGTPYVLEGLGKENVRGMTKAVDSAEIYEVVERREEGDTIYVKCKFTGRPE